MCSDATRSYKCFLQFSLFDVVLYFILGVFFILDKKPCIPLFADPEELNLPVLKQPLHFYRDPTTAPDILHKVNKKIQEADAYIVISAEYNRTIPPALSNTLNHFPPPRYIVLLFKINSLHIVFFFFFLGANLKAACLAFEWVTLPKFPTIC